MIVVSMVASNSLNLKMLLHEGARTIVSNDNLSEATIETKIPDYPLKGQDP